MEGRWGDLVPVVQPYIAGPGDAMDWIFDFVAPDAVWLTETVAATGAMLVGRRTDEVGNRMDADKERGAPSGDEGYPFSPRHWRLRAARTWRSSAPTWPASACSGGSSTRPWCLAVRVPDLWPIRGPSLRRPGTSLARNDRGQVAQRVVEMVWSERRELNVLAGNRPYRRPVIGECDLGLVRAERRPCLAKLSSMIRRVRIPQSDLAAFIAAGWVSVLQARVISAYRYQRCRAA